jgi:hypothetical protein
MNKKYNIKENEKMLWEIKEDVKGEINENIKCIEKYIIKKECNKIKKCDKLKKMI